MAENSLMTIIPEVCILKKFNITGFRGFTLAEVLITLVIIGVIAAMTIPTLINKTNNQEYVTRLKKAYSTFSQATNRIIADEGNPRADIGGWATSTEVVFNMYKKYIAKSQECQAGNACFTASYSHLNTSTPGTAPGMAGSNKYALILSDGSVATMFTDSDNFSSACSIQNFYLTNDVCQVIRVDVNGPMKGPNTIGRDTFAFALLENGLVPVGCAYSSSNCGNYGWGCTCKVLREGAINY